MSLRTTIALVVLSVWMLLTAYSFWQFNPDVKPIEITHDTRFGKLAVFFAHHNCPDKKYVKAYIQAADKYQIPYNLLPAISFQESTCGKHLLYNNEWGWGSGQGLIHFASIEEGIDRISQGLASNSPYRGKSIRDKLKAYGPSTNPDYYKEVLTIMQQINN